MSFPYTSLMPHKVVPLLIEQGASFEKMIQLKNPNGSNFNLNNATARLTLRTRVGGNELLTLTSTLAGLVLMGATGVVVIRMTPAQTGPFNFIEGVYDLRIRKGSSAFIGGRGPVYLLKRITRPS